MKIKLTTILAILLGIGVATFVYERYKAHGDSRGAAGAGQSNHRYLDAANLATGVSALYQLRVHIEDFWYQTEELPCSEGEIELPTELLAAQTPALRDIALTGCGELTATYTEAFGIDGGTLVFRAQEAGQGLTWECVSADFQEIEKHISACRYEPYF